MDISMSKKSKFVCLAMTALMTASIFISAGTSVYASEQDQTTSTSMTTPTVKQFSEQDVNNLANELAKNYPELSKEYLTEGIYKQLRGDYTLEPQGIMTRAGWQGVTVGQMGAAIDTAIAIGLGIGTGGLATAVGTFGKHEVQSAIRVAVAKFLGGKFLNSVILDFAMNLASPGTYIAQQWDKHDKVPNNGRINF
jgi:hypothetical protein